MNTPAGNAPGRRHSLADWLTLHELEPDTCRSMLGAMPLAPAGQPAAHSGLNAAYQPPDLAAAWLSTAEAMREFFSAQHSIIDDTFEKTDKIIVNQRDKSRKALTIDNGPAAYPTIMYSYQSEPSDCLVIAHEFAHALQIRASRGKFVAPVMREVCAFIGEGALLAHTLRRDAAQHGHLAQVWGKKNQRYFGTLSDRLQAALLRPDTPYDYSWNYPIARYLAIQISERCSRDWIWRVFEGELSVRGVLRELGLSPR